MTTQSTEKLEQRLVREAAEEKAKREQEEKQRLDALLSAFRS